MSQEDIKKINAKKMSAEGILHLLNTTEGPIEIKAEKFTIKIFRDGSIASVDHFGRITQKLKDGTIQVIETLEDRQ